MVHMLGHAVGAITDATHGMTLSAVSLPYYKFIMKFVRFAENVWGIAAEGKSDKEIAFAGLDAMEQWMRELGLAISLSEIGATDDMIEDIVNGTFIMEGGYKILTKDEVREIIKSTVSV